MTGFFFRDGTTSTHDTNERAHGSAGPTLERHRLEVDDTTDDPSGGQTLSPGRTSPHPSPLALDSSFLSRRRLGTSSRALDGQP